MLSFSSKSRNWGASLCPEQRAASALAAGRGWAQLLSSIHQGPPDNARFLLPAMVPRGPQLMHHPPQPSLGRPGPQRLPLGCHKRGDGGNQRALRQGNPGCSLLSLRLQGLCTTPAARPRLLWEAKHKRSNRSIACPGVSPPLQRVQK